jgi:hypothetical protein
MLAVFALLLLLANRFTEGERFHGVPAIVTVAVAFAGLLALHRATAESGLWRVRTRQIGLMAAGTFAYILLGYVFNDVLALSLGPVALRPQICIPILFGYALTPAVGFFTGAAGSLLSDFVTGWGVFPAWHIGNGLMGLVPGLVALASSERRNLRYLSTAVVVSMGLAAAVIFAHPRAPEPWTGEMRDFSFWAWVLLVEAAIMLANSYLLERVSVVLAGINLWGTLGILAGHGFASLAHLWIYEYSVGTALIGEFAPSVAADTLNLIIFAPIVLAAYNAVRSPAR